MREPEHTTVGGEERYEMPINKGCFRLGKLGFCSPFSKFHVPLGNPKTNFNSKKSSLEGTSLVVELSMASCKTFFFFFFFFVFFSVKFCSNFTVLSGTRWN